MEVVEEPNGVFLGEMTDQEFEEWERDEVKGWGPFFSNIFNINKKQDANKSRESDEEESPNGDESGSESATDPLRSDV